MKISFLTVLVLITGIQTAYAVNILPRAGVDFVRQSYSNFDNTSNPSIKDNGYGYSTGLAILKNNFYFDFGLESAQIKTPVNSVDVHDTGWRSEVSFSLGYKSGEYLWLNAGLQRVIYGENQLDDDRGVTSSPFVGFTFSNMESGGYLFNVGGVFTFSPDHSGIAAVNNASGGISGGVRFTARKKGSPHLWGWKHRLFAPGLGGFQDITTKLSYSYLFI